MIFLPCALQPAFEVGVFACGYETGCGIKADDVAGRAFRAGKHRMDNRAVLFRRPLQRSCGGDELLPFDLKTFNGQGNIYSAA